MGTHKNTKAGFIKHSQSEVTCRILEEIHEDHERDTDVEIHCLLAGVAMTTAGVMALSDAYLTGLPLLS
jgi:hypothetical protein